MRRLGPRERLENREEGPGPQAPSRGEAMGTAIGVTILVILASIAAWCFIGAARIDRDFERWIRQARAENDELLAKLLEQIRDRDAS